MRTTAPLRVCTHIVMAVLLYNWGCKAAVSTSCSYFGDCAVRQVCDGSTCICDTQHYQSGVNCLITYQYGGYLSKSGLNPGLASPTSPSNACKDSSVCIGGVCTCINGYYDSDGPLAYNGICTALIALSGTCTSGLGVTQCQTNGADCATDNRCRCNQGTFDSNGFGTAGGTCVSVNFLKATLSGFHNDGTTSVTIHWSAPATYSGQVSRYDVVWAEAGGGTRTGTTATSLQVTGLQSATTYNFYIKSIESGSWTADQEVTSESSILVTTKSLLGDTCTAGNCADPNAVCSNTKCVCKSGYYDNDGDTTNVGGTCTARLNPGVTCPVSPTNACKDKSVCTNGFCTCNYGYYDSDCSAPANSGTCMEKLALSVSCNSALTGVVQCSDTNAECTGGNVCRCQTGYFDSNGYNTAGGTCTSRKSLLND
ncbi:prion-like-(Q/N-rich) domain-bearing protein 25 isoform X2 [Argopecten irradians]|uniref:prion-like-(Q/N-rich) domain-bearing protein 25 isoform X2 n=1 Tax=Argopecten irradians TaxID=31199 RepID=UPI0037205A5B